MSITSEYNKSDDALIIHIDYDFDAEMVDEFISAYSSVNDHPKKYYLDMQKVEYIDSAAVGPLLDFCKYIKQNDADAYIINMNDTICEEFRVLNLHKLFKPEFSRKKFGIDWVFHGENEKKGDT